MGREVKRVPLDFDWPLKKVYSGFVLEPDIQGYPCQSCEQSGYSPRARYYKSLWYGYLPFQPSDTGSTAFTPDSPGMMEHVRSKLAFDLSDYEAGYTRRFYDNMFGTTGEDTVLAEAQRLCDLHNGQFSHHLDQQDVDALLEGGRLHSFTHTWDNETSRYVANDPTRHPSAAEINLRSIYGMGHDSINCGIVIRARCEREGVAVLCVCCEGEGTLYRDDEHKEKNQNWTPTEPPTGDGWQMWENTTEGSPISPVFATPEELAQWLADTEASVFGDQSATYKEWFQMICGVDDDTP